MELVLDGGGVGARALDAAGRTALGDGDEALRAAALRLVPEVVLLCSHGGSAEERSARSRARVQCWTCEIVKCAL